LSRSEARLSVQSMVLPRIRWPESSAALRISLCAREAITGRGATLMYLPPYSPDLNPIEQYFAKLKALLRKAAARTGDALWVLRLDRTRTDPIIRRSCAELHGPAV
jgi:transposase